ncbi:hypothetical protein CSUB01_03317 [Colletotrichum sublineola]|uniref:Bacteriophage T5 Orf172 DNA-binding domain-containing protein n=1 Tax=Colletotrichum sublineola TaxID=1173701 RepID=A0A066XHY4_COLSU|nr:hypothetical protein CSUB01_03317 [Colletotrichum sublineola]
MQSFDISPDEKTPDLPGPKKNISRRVISGSAITSRPKAAMGAQLSPASSPPMPTQSGLTPMKPRQRRSSINLPVPDGDAPRDAVLLRPEPPEESDCEMDTPTKKPAPRARRKPSGLNKQLGRSPLRTMTPPGPNVTAGYKAAGVRQLPLFARSHTSPETQDEAERKRRRPSAAERSASDPATPLKKLSGAQLDSSMAKLIRDGPSKDKATQLKDGGIYLFIFQPRGTGAQLVKIGRTERDAQGRLKEIKAVCKPLKSAWHSTATAENIPFHGFAERLIHAELYNYRHRRRCVCGTEHREYFEVSEDIAVEVFKRWRDFCQKRPWDDGGTIRTLWSKRLDTRTAFDGPGQDFDHGKFGRHWSTYTMPWLIELMLSDAIYQWKRWFPYRWRAVAVAELFTIIFLSPVSAWAQFWIATVGALCVIDTAVPEDLHVTASVARLMEGGSQSLVLWYMSWRDGLAADVKGLAPEASSGETPPHQETGGDVWSETAEEDTAALSDGASSIGCVGDPMDINRDGGCQESTDEDGPGGDVGSPATVKTASVQDGVSERPKSLGLNAQKMPGKREVMIEVVDLTHD